MSFQNKNKQARMAGNMSGKGGGGREGCVGGCGGGGGRRRLLHVVTINGSWDTCRPITILSSTSRSYRVGRQGAACTGLAEFLHNN